MNQERIFRKVRAGAPASWSYIEPKQKDEVMSLRQLQDEFMALHQSADDDVEFLARPIFVWSFAFVLCGAIWFTIYRALA